MFGSLSQETAIFQKFSTGMLCLAQWHMQVNISGSWILDPQNIPVTRVSDMVWGVVNLLAKGKSEFCSRITDLNLESLWP